MESVGYDLSPEQLGEMFHAFDIDKNGKISFWEFVRSVGTTEDGVPLWGKEDDLGEMENISVSMSNDDVVRRIQRKVAENGNSVPQLWRQFETSFSKTMDSPLFQKAMKRLGLNIPVSCHLHRPHPFVHSKALKILGLSLLVLSALAFCLDFLKLLMRDGMITSTSLALIRIIS